MEEPFEPYVSWFQNVLEQSGAASNTCRSYLAAVRQYYQFYDTFSAEAFQSHRSWLLSHYTPNTANCRILGINRYLSALRELSEAPASSVPPALAQASQLLSRPGIPSRIMGVTYQKKHFLDSIISQRDYEKLKRGLKKDNNMFWYFVVRFLGATGARVSELTQIRREHVALGFMDLYSKGGKLRRIYFPDALCRETLLWLGSRPEETDYIFAGRQGRPITPRGIGSQLKQLACRYHIPPETVYPHSFRHRFAKNFLSRFNDIALLADLLGHESIETTRIYLTKSRAEQRALIDRIVTW